ncbi:tetratricopeptide repeat protein [Spiribacter halobius]|uniref:Uncharacterized protein n=1 Tax=Sediminicurvatus halobius TaxID=2182432 RepID=A0A2U2N0X4_9GAMM|nr:tetratricopeptide repeat protein [Spiribacter halobius]PWG62693.1 hypothetical protein DEM34_11110 [Spiribacter halobius]UEX77362.1 tetratricopeptide repeat protein [Spiribacter halobius]
MARALARPLLVLTAAAAFLLTGCDAFESTAAEEHLQAAREFLDEGDARSAEIELRNALQKKGDLAEARLALGQLRLRAGDSASAVKELRRAVSLGVGEDRAGLDLAEALLLEDQPEEALAQLQGMSMPEGEAAARLQVLRGYALRATGDEAQGCAAFESAVARAPELPRGHIGLAECAAADGRYTAAAGRLVTVLDRHPGNVRAWERLAEVELARGRARAAGRAYRKILEQSAGLASARIGLARTLLARDAREEAERELDRALQANAESPAAHYLLGLLRLRQERFDDAIASLQAALSAAPEHTGALFYLGAAHFAEGSYEQASRYLQQVVRQRPALDRARTLLRASEARLAGRDERGPESISFADLEVEAELTDDSATEPGAVGDAADGGAAAASRVDAQAGGSSPDALPGTDADSGVERIAGNGELGVALAEAVELLRGGAPADARERLKGLRERYPDDARLPLIDGLSHLSQGNEAAAEEALTEALGLDPEQVTAHQGLATLALRAGDVERARAHYDAALGAAPGSLPTQLALFELARRTGDADSARRWVEQARQDNPDSPVAAALYALVLASDGELNEALEVTEAALEDAPADEALGLLHGDLLLQMERENEAVVAYERALTRNPESVRGYLKLAGAYSVIGDGQAVRAALQAALDVQPENPAIILALATQASRQDQHERALELTSRLPDGTEGMTDSLVVTHAEILLRAGRADESVAVLEKALTAFPDSRAVRLALSQVQWQRGDRAAARETLERWLDGQPADGPAWRVLGDRRLASGDERGAEAAYRRALEADPDDWRALNNLASTIGERAPQEALEFARRAHEQAPESPFVQDTLGWLLVRADRPEQGLELLVSAADQLQALPTVRYHLAEALVANQQPQDARSELTSLLADAGDFPERDAAEALLEQLQ